MKIFLVLFVLIGLGVVYGFIEANNQGIAINPETVPWEALLVLPLLLVAWWLSRKREQ